MRTFSETRKAIILACSLLAGCGQFTYGVDMLNYGESGVLILQVGDLKADGPHQAYVDLGVTVPIIAGRYPRPPIKYRDPASYFGRFVGYENSLPDSVTIVWQLADLRGCRSVSSVGVSGEDSEEHVTPLPNERLKLARENSCTWVPIPDKIFRSSLDMQAIRESPAYKRTGGLAKGIAGGRLTLNITLIFVEDQLKIEVDNGATNPWL